MHRSRFAMTVLKPYSNLASPYFEIGCIYNCNASVKRRASDPRSRDCGARFTFALSAPEMTKPCE